MKETDQRKEKKPENAVMAIMVMKRGGADGQHHGVHLKKKHAVFFYTELQIIITCADSSECLG